MLTVPPPGRLRDASPDGQPHHWMIYPYERYVSRGVCDCGAVRFFANNESKISLQRAAELNEKKGKKGSGHEIKLPAGIVESTVEKEDIIMEKEEAGRAKLPPVPLKKDYTLYNTEEKKLIAQEAEKNGRKAVGMKYGVPGRVLWGWVHVFCRGLNRRDKTSTPAISATPSRAAEVLGAKLHEEVSAPPPAPPPETDTGTEIPEAEARQEPEASTRTASATNDPIFRIKLIFPVNISVLPRLPEFNPKWKKEVQVEWFHIYRDLALGRKQS